jgi:hypothetical protein
MHWELEEHVENPLGTWLEHIGNKKIKHPDTPLKEKEPGPPRCMLAHIIG